MPYWQYEIIIENIKEINKKAEEDQKKQEKNGGMPAGYQMPKMPAMPQLPTISIPKF